MMARRAWLLACVGCSADERARVPELVRAVDLNPDPNIVEINLIANEARVSLRDGMSTNVLAYAAGGEPTMPGPMIEAKRGDRLIVHFTNAMSDRDTTVHWHGLRLPIEMDGDPMVVNAVPPGGSYDYDITLRDAGLFWYHPHVMTDEQIELGLQGVLLVHDTDEPTVTADRAFVLDDVDLDTNGAIEIEPSKEDLALGRRGSTLLVNGREPGRIVASPGAIERWRFVNTSNGRFFDLSIGAPMRVIASDGGLVPQPYDVDHLVVAPGERYEVLVKLDRALDIETFAVDRGEGIVDAAARLVDVELTGDAVQASMPTLARVIEPLVPSSVVQRFVLREELSGSAGSVFFINEQRWPFNTPIDVKLGDAETWEIVNDNDHEHPFHIHGHFAQVVDQPQLGWKDTIRVPAHSTTRVVLRYETPGKWMAHCQIPEHAERGMTADINVSP